jgi:hypothetical protein
VKGPEDVLRAALEAAGLSLQAIPEEQRAMFTSLTEEQVTRLITMRAGRWAAEATQRDGVTADDAPAASESNGSASARSDGSTVRRRSPRPDASAACRKTNDDC